MVFLRNYASPFGGWAPIAALKSLLTTPRFDGIATVNVDSCFSVHGRAQWLTPLGISGVLELVGHPQSDAPGIALEIAVKRQVCCPAPPPALPPAQPLASFVGASPLPCHHLES